MKHTQVKTNEIGMDKTFIILLAFVILLIIPRFIDAFLKSEEATAVITVRTNAPI